MKYLVNKQINKKIFKTNVQKTTYLCPRTMVSWRPYYPCWSSTAWPPDSPEWSWSSDLLISLSPHSQNSRVQISAHTFTDGMPIRAICSKIQTKTHLYQAQHSKQQQNNIQLWTLRTIVYYWYIPCLIYIDILKSKCTFYRRKCPHCSKCWSHKPWCEPDLIMSVHQLLRAPDTSGMSC